VTLALDVCRAGSSRGSTASLLGWGVNWDVRNGADRRSFSAGFLGELLSGKVVGREGVGVFEKNEWRFRCPCELDFFKVEGVGVGVDDACFLAMLESWHSIRLQGFRDTVHVHVANV
jgi:hypothetical protein